MDPRIRITDLTRDDGHWSATVHHSRGVTRVDRKYGSWMQLVDKPIVANGVESTATVRREVPHHVAAALQAQVLPIERAERKRTAREAVAA